MDYDVLKPFNTVNRRFKPAADADAASANDGSIVLDTDDLTPHTIEGLEKRGFIKVRAAKPPVAPPANKLDTASLTPAPATSEK
ncbi:hypothetical protein [Bradyrhizobium sp. Leo170]|uniref:hypothetical protein n=1 Tax=Bradyrhizobium sp. Leo170 TaxID=1571199 RepID=UPI00102EA02B|nr:hypothetical protein [Bradyrhizobium sp. Leo170]TAI67578.1 hypothetical protein CWO89_01820 [Bradyrhizobium sp. Leo170]